MAEVIDEFDTVTNMLSDDQKFRFINLLEQCVKNYLTDPVHGKKWVIHLNFDSLMTDKPYVETRTSVNSDVKQWIQSPAKTLDLGESRCLYIYLLINEEDIPLEFKSKLLKLCVYALIFGNTSSKNLKNDFLHLMAGYYKAWFKGENREKVTENKTICCSQFLFYFLSKPVRVNVPNEARIKIRLAQEIGIIDIIDSPGVKKEINNIAQLFSVTRNVNVEIKKVNGDFLGPLLDYIENLDSLVSSSQPILFK
jgi:hypothetical protein